MRDHIKTPKTFQQQIGILRARGVSIHSVSEAEEILSRINYYRLSAYLLTYKNKDGTYANGASIENAYSLYQFDQQLRNLLLPVLENIEIAFRTHIAYLIAHKYGALGYQNPNNFRCSYFHRGMMDHFTTEINRSTEIFVGHHKEKYGGVFPVWVIIELASFGALSKIFKNLNANDQNEIGQRYYGVRANLLSTWLHSLANLRNICAHYGRLYNRPLRVSPKLFAADKSKVPAKNTLFANMLVMKRLTVSKLEWAHAVTRLGALFEQQHVVNLKYIGFPANWEDILRAA